MYTYNKNRRILLTPRKLDKGNVTTHFHFFTEMGLDPFPFPTLLQKFMLPIQSGTAYASIISHIIISAHIKSLFSQSTLHIYGFDTFLSINANHFNHKNLQGTCHLLRNHNSL